MNGTAGRAALLQGTLAGLVGGLVFGAAMVPLGMLATVASLVRTETAAAGFAVHLAVAGALGAGLGVLVARQRSGSGEMLFWGLAYGASWWFLGNLTLLPLLSGRPVDWSIAAAQTGFPSLLGHLLYGAVAGLVLALLRGRGEGPRPTASVVLRGALAGLAAGASLVALLETGVEPLALSSAMRAQPGGVATAANALLGLVAGVGLALLYPRPPAAGPILVRGTAYGFLLWVVVALTVVPLLEGAGLTWSVSEVRDGFVTLPGYLMLGTVVALLYRAIGGLWRLLFSGPAERGTDAEGPGARGLRAVGRGAVAGVVGGLLFTVVMVEIGFLGTVAALVGATSDLVGFAVHLAISVAIGASYGLAFRAQTYDAASALGWGVAYGLLWWVLGAITLLPVLLGGTPQWSADAAADAFPSLVGHLAYGAGLGLVYHALEARFSPWWLARSQQEARRVELRREELLTAAPAVWLVTLLVALVIPIVLAAPTSP